MMAELAALAVIGAGPAGSMTAYHALKQPQFRDRKVIILDRRMTPGTPVNCAGGIASEWLTAADIAPPYDMPNEIVASRIYSMRLYAPDLTCVDIDLASPRAMGYTLHRDRFDKWLLERAIKAGAEFRPGTSFKKFERDMILTNKGNILAETYVGADGWQSRVGRELGLHGPLHPDDMYTCYQELREATNASSEHKIYLFFGSNYAPKGYVWYFPVGKDRARIGVGVPFSIGHPKQLLQRFYKKVPPFSKGRILGKLIKVEGGMIPATMPMSNPYCGAMGEGGVAFVGDAARHTNAATGGGIHTALLGGKILGEAIGTDRGFEHYKKETEKTFYKQLKRAYTLKRMLWNFTDRDYNRARESLESVDLSSNASLGAGKLFRTLARKMIRKNPRLLWYLLKAMFGAHTARTSPETEGLI